jgi:hypothetical protein
MKHASTLLTILSATLAHQAFHGYPSYRTARPLREPEPEPEGPTLHDLARIEAARLKRERKASTKNTHPAEPQQSTK